MRQASKEPVLRPTQVTSGARSVGTHAHLVKASPLVKGMEGPFFATHPIATPRPP